MLGKIERVKDKYEKRIEKLKDEETRTFTPSSTSADGLMFLNRRNR